MSRSASPCMRCYRVADPKNCENKNCKLWQRWFIDRWEAMRTGVRAAMDRAETEKVGCAVSGTYYAPPHQVEQYLAQDPCDACLCPRELCSGAPCRVRKNWDDARREVLL